MSVNKCLEWRYQGDVNKIVISLAATVDEKSSTLSTNASDLTASRDICSPAATADQKMIAPAVVVDGKSLITNTNTPDKTASHDILSAVALVNQHMTVLSRTPSQECLVVETDTDGVSAKLTKSQKINRRLKIKRNKNIESFDKREVTENHGSLGAIASIDLKILVLSLAATVDEKSSIPSTNATDQIASRDTLSTKVHEAVSSETGSDKTVTDSGKLNAIDGSSAMEVTEAISGEMVLGPEVVNSEISTSNTTSKQKTNKQKVGVNPSENKEITQATVGKKLVIVNVKGMLTGQLDWLGQGSTCSSSFAYCNLGESVASVAKTSQANNVVIALASSEGLTSESKPATALAITKGTLLEEAEKIVVTYTDVMITKILDMKQCVELKMGSYLGVAAHLRTPLSLSIYVINLEAFPKWD
uniref:Leucine aminopeptidase 2, chloroplastic n=1 Tax=Tanacetum cinerariifolium TaxID=118510 RepID=A0A699HM82_TANCI|nr:leucine aminopeptidase 2, chloroplastic [Tanacetum cinerariifolium]